MKVQVSESGFPVLLFILMMVHSTGGPDALGQESASGEGERATVAVANENSTRAKGLSVKGRVVDNSGNPISGATVREGSPLPGVHGARTETDMQGSFNLQGFNPGRTILTVQATGYAPDMKLITVEANMPAVRFQLESGGTIRGRLVDADGNPITEAKVYLFSWRDDMSLDWQTKTNVKGHFRWDSAPLDEVKLGIIKKGFLRKLNVAIRSGDGMVTFQLNRPFTIRGHIVDAETSQPLKASTVIPGIWFSPVATPQPSWDRQKAVETKDGTYEITFDTLEYPGFAVKAEAKDYLPAVSPIFKPTDNNGLHIFRLMKPTTNDGITAQVISPDGQAVHGGKVFLVSAGMYFEIRDGHAKEPDSVERTITDENGRFRLYTEEVAFAIVVLHDTGYAQVRGKQLSKSDRIVLTPWARVEGTLHLRSEPVANAQMSLGIGQTYGRGPRDRNAPDISWHHDSRTDERGRFEFDRVPAGHRRRDEQGRFEFDFPPAGRCVISRSISGGGRNAMCERSTMFVEPGKTQHVAMHVAAFRSVVGRIVAPQNMCDQIDWPIVRVEITPKIEVPHADLPKRWASMSDDDKRRWVDDWLNTKEGMAYQRAKDQQNLRNARVKLEPDGSFRIDHVQAGPYELSVICRHKSSDGSPAKAIAKVAHEFVVSGVPGAANDKPVNLGTLELIPLGTAERGDMAPLFEVDTASGKVLKLADCRGKYVLLDFWATWCAPCMREKPHLDAVSDAFGDDERVVMIGLSLDSDLGSWKRYVDGNKNNWIHAFLGGPNESDIPNKYNVQGIPAIFLIGPDGKILARGLRGKAIGKAVANALGSDGDQ